MTRNRSNEAWLSELRADGAVQAVPLEERPHRVEEEVAHLAEADETLRA